MATASTEKLKTMVECPICLGTFNNPLALLCLHFYCEPCVHDLKPVTEGGKTGYNCPLCRQFTPRDSLRPMRFVKELLEVVDIAEKEQLCEKCKTEKPIWRCNDCKENYCQACRNTHDEFSFLKIHKWAALGEKSQPVVDKHVFCTEHPEEHVKIYCEDCNKLICLLCNATEHKNHSAQTIQNALKEIIPIVKENRDKVENLIANTEKVLGDEKAQVAKLSKACENLESEIDQKCEQAIKKAREDAQKLKKDLNARKKKQLTTGEENIRTLELKLKSQKNIVKLSDTTLSTAQGTSLLSAIQSGLIDSLVSFIEEKPENVPRTKELNAKLIPAALPQENVIGEIVDADFENHVEEAQNSFSMFIPRRLTGIDKFPVKLVKSTPGKFSARAAKIQHQLWCVEHNTTKINVFSINGQKVKTLCYEATGKCRSVAEVQDDAVIASEKGLFLCNKDGKTVCKLQDGDFCDVSVMASTVYALDNRNGTIYILQKQRNTKNGYNKTRQIQISCYTHDFWNTMQVTNKYIYVGLNSKHQILQFTHSGEFVATHGSKGSDTGQLKHPLISGADPDGVLLIADSNNHRLVSLMSDGKWTRIHVEGMGEYPCCTVIAEDRLFVWKGGIDRSVQEFTFK